VGLDRGQGPRALRRVPSGACLPLAVPHRACPRQHSKSPSGSFSTNPEAQPCVFCPVVWLAFPTVALARRCREERNRASCYPPP
jgi:hypothetical protein